MGTPANAASDPAGSGGRRGGGAGGGWPPRGDPLAGAVLRAPGRLARARSCLGDRRPPMNKREAVLSLLLREGAPTLIPAAFFLHFDRAYHLGQAAIDRQIEFFRATGMDLVKIQYEQRIEPSIHGPEDWKHIRPQPEQFFEPTVRVVDGLVRAARHEALVILTLYS